MNKDIIKQARKKYEELIKAKDELVEVRNELLKEKQNETIKKCLKVVEKEELKIPNESEILRYSFYNLEQEENSSNIYVFMGGYKKNNKKSHDILTSDYKKADYFVYQDLEKMFSGKVIYPKEQKQFEKDNIVLRFKDNTNIKDKFYNLQIIYFMEYLNNENITQEKVLAKLKENL